MTREDLPPELEDILAAWSASPSTHPLIGDWRRVGCRRGAGSRHRPVRRSTPRASASSRTGTTTRACNCRRRSTSSGRPVEACCDSTPGGTHSTDRCSSTTRTSSSGARASTRPPSSYATPGREPARQHRLVVDRRSGVLRRTRTTRRVDEERMELEGRRRLARRRSLRRRGIGKRADRTCSMSATRRRWSRARCSCSRSPTAPTPTTECCREMGGDIKGALEYPWDATLLAGAVWTWPVVVTDVLGAPTRVSSNRFASPSIPRCPAQAPCGSGPDGPRQRCRGPDHRERGPRGDGAQRAPGLATGCVSTRSTTAGLPTCTS